MNKLKKILFGAAVLASVALLLFPVAVMLSVSLKRQMMYLRYRLPGFQKNLLLKITSRYSGR